MSSSSVDFSIGATTAAREEIKSGPLAIKLVTVHPLNSISLLYYNRNIFTFEAVIYTYLIIMTSSFDVVGFIFLYIYLPFRNAVIIMKYILYNRSVYRTAGNICEEFNFAFCN